MGREPEFTRDTTIAYAVRTYGSRQHLSGVSITSHAERVADTAERLCLAWYQDTQRLLTASNMMAIDAIWHAGMLHEAIDSGGRSYEEIGWHTSKEIADIVAAVSYDYRMPLSRRTMERIGRILDGPIPYRILGLSDLVADVEDIGKMMHQHPRSVSRYLQVWLPIARLTHSYFKRLKTECETLLRVWKWIERGLQWIHETDQQQRREAASAAKNEIQVRIDVCDVAFLPPIQVENRIDYEREVQYGERG